MAVCLEAFEWIIPRHKSRCFNSHTRHIVDLVSIAQNLEDVQYSRAENIWNHISIFMAFQAVKHFHLVTLSRILGEGHRFCVFRETVYGFQQQ